MTKIIYSGYRFPPEIIQQPIWLYLRFHTQLPRRGRLAGRARVAVFYVTVRRWVNHFGPIIAADLRKRRPGSHSIRHLDEVYLKIGGRMVYLWLAVDAEGEVLDVNVQSTRIRHAALKDTLAPEEIHLRARTNAHGRLARWPRCRTSRSYPAFPRPADATAAGTGRGQLDQRSARARGGDARMVASRSGAPSGDAPGENGQTVVREQGGHVTSDRQASRSRLLTRCGTPAA